MADSDEAVRILERLMKALMAENTRFMELIDQTGQGMFPQVPVSDRDREVTTEKFEAYLEALKFLQDHDALD